MKRILQCVMGLMVVLGVLGNVQASNTEAEPVGYIRFAEQPDGGGRSCSIPIKDITIDLNDGAYGCSSDDYSYFMLDNAPSAAYFHLNSDGGCPSDGGHGNDWNFDFKTYKHPTTTVWISILSLKGYASGDIIKAGVLMTKKRYESGDVNEELECVRIEVSPLP